MNPTATPHADEPNRGQLFPDDPRIKEGVPHPNNEKPSPVLNSLHEQLWEALKPRWNGESSIEFSADELLEMVPDGRKMGIHTTFSLLEEISRYWCEATFPTKVQWWNPLIHLTIELENDEMVGFEMTRPAGLIELMEDRS